MEKLTLGVEAMDETHAAFLQLLTGVKNAEAEAFLEGFSALIAHTEQHFATEEAWMRNAAYYGYAEHREEHENLLNEMRYFFDKARRLPAFGHSYINDYAYDKFRRHIINIDSQLAMFLKTEGIAEEVPHA